MKKIVIGKVKLKGKGVAVLVSAAIVILVLVCLAVWGIANSGNNISKDNIATELHPDFTLTALTGNKKSTPNTLSAIKNAAQSNCKNIQLDLMFNSKDEPVLTDKADDVDKKTTVPLAVAFKTLKTSYKDIDIVLKIHELTNLEKVEELAEQYEMLERLYFCGVNKDNAEYINFKTPNIRYMLDMSLDKSKIDDKDYVESCLDIIKGAYSVNLDFKKTSTKWIELLAGKEIKVSLYNVDSKADVFKALNMNAQNIFTKNPGETQSIVRDWLIKR